MSITLTELNPKNVPLTPDMLANQQTLHARMNLVRDKRGIAMIITSGVRSLADHKRIYADLAKQRGLAFIRVPMGSKHLIGAACDVYDPNGSHMAWCQANEAFLAEVGLWMEQPDDQHRVHFQCVPYGSWAPGKSQFFKP